MSTQDEFDATWQASADELAGLQDLQDQLAAQREQTAAARAAAQEELAALTGARGEVQGQTRGLEGDVGSFRAEQKLAADAARTATAELVTSQGGDFYAPDVGQQIAPDGTITYDFDAHLHARGVDLDAGDTSSPSSDRRVQWLRTSDGALIAQLDAYAQGGTRISRHRAIANSFEPGVAQLVAYNEIAPTQGALLQCQAGGAGVPRSFVTAGTQADRTILDANGASHFLQAAAASAFRVAYGVAIVTWGGAGTVGGPAVASHNLGAVPQAVMLGAALRSDGSAGAMAHYSVRDPNSISVFAYSATGIPANGTSMSVSWLVIA